MIASISSAAGTCDGLSEIALLFNQAIHLRLKRAGCSRGCASEGSQAKPLSRRPRVRPPRHWFSYLRRLSESPWAFSGRLSTPFCGSVQESFITNTIGKKCLNADSNDTITSKVDSCCRSAYYSGSLLLGRRKKRRKRAKRTRATKTRAAARSFNSLHADLSLSPLRKT